jgi:hypothetical protein
MWSVVAVAALLTVAPPTSSLAHRTSGSQPDGRPKVSTLPASVVRTSAADVEACRAARHAVLSLRKHSKGRPDIEWWRVPILAGFSPVDGRRVDPQTYREVLLKSWVQDYARPGEAPAAAMVDQLNDKLGKKIKDREIETRLVHLDDLSDLGEVILLEENVYADGDLGRHEMDRYFLRHYTLLTSSKLKNLQSISINDHNEGSVVRFRHEIYFLDVAGLELGYLILPDADDLDSSRSIAVGSDCEATGRSFPSFL